MTKFEYYSGVQDVQWFPEATTQTFKKGMPIFADSGKLKVCTDGGVKMLGIADADATGTVDTWLPVILAHPTTRFVGSSSNAGANITAAITHLLTDCDLYLSGSTVSVDLGTTGSTLLRAVAFHPDHIPTSATATIVEATNAKVIFKVIDGKSQATDLDQ